MLYETTISVPASEVRECQSFLDEVGEDRVATFRTFTGIFSNGVEVDIKVCDGDPPFVDPVLFENGSELTISEVRDSLLGEYRFKVGEDEYKATVIETRKVRFFNIVWDLDKPDDGADLPTEVVCEDVPKGVDVALEGADKLSDAYGWCVRSFDFEEQF